MKVYFPFFFHRIIIFYFLHIIFLFFFKEYIKNPEPKINKPIPQTVIIPNEDIAKADEASIGFNPAGNAPRKTEPSK